MTIAEANKELLKEFVSKFGVTLRGTSAHGYFIFDNNVLEFELEEFPGWSFAFWSGYMEDEEYQPDRVELICEHDEFVDKFKPGRTWYTGPSDDLERFRSYLELMKNNPRAAFVSAMHGYDNPGIPSEVYNTTEEEFIKEEIEHYVEDKHGRAAWYSYSRALLLRFLRYLVTKYGLDYAGLIDGNKNGWKTSPRYTLIMCSDDDSIVTDKLFEEIDIYEKLLRSNDVYRFSWALRDLDISPITDVYFSEDKKDEECSILIYKENPDEVIFKKRGRIIKDGIPRKSKVKKLEERAKSFGKEVEY